MVSAAGGTAKGPEGEWGEQKREKHPPACITLFFPTINTIFLV